MIKKINSQASSDIPIFSTTSAGNEPNEQNRMTMLKRTSTDLIVHIVMRGWMSKRGKGGMFGSSSFRKRYFMLDTVTSRVYYFLSDDHANIWLKKIRLHEKCDLAKGFICLDDVVSVNLEGPASIQTTKEDKAMLLLGSTSSSSSSSKKKSR